MRFLILSLTLLLCAVAGRADEFPTDFPVSFRFHETYKDKVVGDPDFPGDFLVVPSGILQITAVAPVTKAVTDTLDESSPIYIEVGDFVIDRLLGDLDGDYDPLDPEHNRSVTIVLQGFNSNGDFEDVGSFNVTWLTSGRVTMSVTVTDSTEDYTVAATEYYPNINDPAIDSENLTVALQFGPYTLDIRTVYMIGRAISEPDPQDRVFEDLSDVDLYGAIDSVKPSVAIAFPPPPPPGISKTVITVNESPNGLYTFSGTSSDTRSVNGQTFPNKVNQVEVQHGIAAGQGNWVNAPVDEFGNWSLPNVQLFLGSNFVTVRATDADSNFEISQRSFTYALNGNVTVTASASNYTGAAGSVAGTVSGSFFKVGTRKITMLVGGTPPIDKTLHDAGKLLKVTAVPGVGSVFNGWKGTINGNTVLDEVPEVLTFEAKPNLILTADFVPNPFTPAIVGKYQGLITGPDPAGRGTFRLTLSKTGGFTGTVTIGALALPIKGKVLGSGIWRGIVKKLNKTYNIALNLNVGLNGDRQVAGTVTGNGLNSAFVADLNTWKSKTNEATAFAATYNVLLPAAQTNSDPNFPAGVGYARVTITKLGSVKFLGKLGDGSPLVGTSTLVQRPSGPVVFPLHVALDKKLGGVSGLVTYDATQPTSDLSGNLEWQEPATTGVDPFAFSGRIALHGSRYTKPVGTRVILEASAGNGGLTLSAPVFSKPTNISPTQLGPTTFPVVLDLATNGLGPIDQLAVKAVKLKFNTSTGLFTGSFRDESLKKTIPIFGAASTKANAAGGVFIRGNRSGKITLAQ